ncbi:MAG: hypothetical protein H7Y30_01525, partial [Pyrinomonadaceae bacterium]|nr:hypothetical protein [Pyrinomonadaceae bacterium]
KLDPNMEIDRLLRRHARRGATAPIASTLHNESGGGVRAKVSGMTHLDADELNAFSENAVPAAARARYAAHLAECDACRKIVTELVMTSGVAQELERQAVKNVASSTTTAPARSWGARLSALFAPRTLRYAASVVLLVGLVSIAFTVFRYRREMSVTTPAEKSSNVSTNQNSDGQLADRNATVTDQKVTNTNSATPPESVASKPDASGNVVPPTASGGEATDATVSQPAPVQGPSDSPAAPAAVPGGVLAGKASEPARDEEAVKTGRQDTTASTTSDKLKDNKQVGGVDSSASGASLANKRADDDRNYDEQSGASAESKRRPAKEESPATTTTARKRAGARAQSPPASVSKTEVDNRVEREDISNQPGETRRAGGRQFVRRGSAWVDTAYKSQATTNVKRNSDQYRALAADEPGLRAIADQLRGEVIIVWKGRAYRIY